MASSLQPKNEVEGGTRAQTTMPSEAVPLTVNISAHSDLYRLKYSSGVKEEGRTRCGDAVVEKRNL